MPDSFGKRQRREVKAKKAAAREGRRVARNQRREDRAAGIVTGGPDELEPGELEPGELEPGELEPGHHAGTDPEETV